MANTTNIHPTTSGDCMCQKGKQSQVSTWRMMLGGDIRAELSQEAPFVLRPEQSKKQKTDSVRSWHFSRSQGLGVSGKPNLLETLHS
jgi:hypothetical protein